MGKEIVKLMNGAYRDGIPFLFAVDFELKNYIFIKHPLSQSEILFRTPQISNINRNSFIKEKIEFESYPESYERYLERFNVVMSGLKRGDSFLTNLTVRTPIKMSLGLKDIAESCDAPFCLYVPDKFVCFSPERFVKIKENKISSYPMKGTIDASIPNAEQIILSDEKETAEHNTIVDLIRNDIGIVAKDVNVERFRYVDELRTNKGHILQTSSEIIGTMYHDECMHLGDVIFAMLPAGSVSGAPKQSTLNIIEKAELMPRGFYSGVFGYFDGAAFDSAVMIRFIEQDNNEFYFRSGGGITVMSNPRDEYEEVIQKIYLPII